MYEFALILRSICTDMLDLRFFLRGAGCYFAILVFLLLLSWNLV